MPDLKSEMTKVINQWDTPKEQPMHTELSMAEQVFEIVKAYGNATVNDVKGHFEERKHDFVSSSLSNLYNRGILGRREEFRKHYTGTGKRTQFLYYPLTEECVTQVKGYSSAKPKKKTLGSAKPKQILVVDKPLERIEEVKPVKKEFDPEKFVHGLTLTEIKQLHKFLESYFE